MRLAEKLRASRNRNPVGKTITWEAVEEIAAALEAAAKPATPPALTVERPEHAPSCPAWAAWDIPDACNCGGKYREPDDDAPASPPVAPAHETLKNTDTPDGKAQGAIRFYESPHQEVARILPDGTVIFPAHERLMAEIERWIASMESRGEASPFYRAVEADKLGLLRRCLAALSAEERIER